MIKTIQPTGTLADDLQGMCLPEVAERLRCSRRFLENQIKAGWLRVMRLSKSYRVSSKNPGVFKRDFGIFFSSADINEIVADVVERRHIMVGHKLRNKRADFKVTTGYIGQGYSEPHSKVGQLFREGELIKLPAAVEAPSTTLPGGVTCASEAAYPVTSGWASKTISDRELTPSEQEIQKTPDNQVLLTGKSAGVTTTKQRRS